MCGEEQAQLGSSYAKTGSPPHVRGRAQRRYLLWRLAGITPACAGKRKTPLENGFRPGDHPRMCGEEPLRERPKLRRMGSPPHVRGRAEIRIRHPGTERITPACAGKSRWNASIATLAWDHPRMCGEERGFLARPHRGTGSPPHVRGRVCPPIIRPGGAGITPACAGKSFTASVKIAPMRDHPRMCGEELFQLNCPLPLPGSPPHVRGRAHFCFLTA